VPRVDVLISGTFRSLPYAGSEFPSIQSQSLSGQVLALNIPAIGLVDPNLKLNRAFGSGIPVENFQIVKPGALYGDRLNAVDLRFGKILKYGTTKSQITLDVYNLFNSNTTEVYQRTYTPPGPTSAYLNPLSIMSARFFKITAQIDF